MNNIYQSSDISIIIVSVDIKCMSHNQIRAGKKWISASLVSSPIC